MNMKYYVAESQEGINKYKRVSPFYDSTADACEWIEKKYKYNEKQTQRLWNLLMDEKLGLFIFDKEKK